MLITTAESGSAFVSRRNSQGGLIYVMVWRLLVDSIKRSEIERSITGYAEDHLAQHRY